MRIKAFTIAFGISAGIQVIYHLFVAAIAWLILPSALAQVNGSILPNLPAYTSVFNFSLLGGGIGLLLAPFVHLGTGLLYGLLHRRESGTLRAEDGAFGGAAAAALARVLPGFLTVTVSAFLAPGLNAALSGRPVFDPAGVPGFNAEYFLGAIIGGVISICLSAVFAAGLGALGGALAAALRR